MFQTVNKVSEESLTVNNSMMIEISLLLCIIVGIIVIINKKKVKKSSEEKTLDDYSYRELFHMFINQEYHYDKYHLAKEFSEQMHFEASQYMMNDHEDDPDFADHFTYFPYDKEKVNERLDFLAQKLFQIRYLDWCDEGQPVSSESRYWWAQTKVHLITYLIQREPFHLTDGIWLRGVSQGPMSSIDAKLFSIYIDELGNGDIHQNHPNVYLNVLKDLGLNVPSILSREFVDQKSILDISFKKPLLTLTTSLFPKTFQPEILGYTLWLETTSASEHAGLRKIFDRYDLNPKFSLLHTAIDNNLNGHGKYARDAIEEYLDFIQQTEGDQALQIHWKRIWIGYVAYGITGNIDKDLKQLYQQQKIQTPQDEFIQLIKRKAPLAQKMHGSRRIGSHQYLLNDLFSSGDAQTICNELQNSDMIVKGCPEKSKLLNHAVQFNGPMYQVFNSDELSIIVRWILSLSPSTVNEMISLILKRRTLAQLIECDIKLKLPDGKDKFLKDLFQGKPNDLLSAFRASKWTIPHDGSKLTEDNVQTTELIKSIQPNGILENIFDNNSEDKDIITNWLLDGSPLNNETLTQNNIQIISHQNFKFIF